MVAITHARRVGRIARALLAACGEAAPAANPFSPSQAPTWTSRSSFQSAPLARLRTFHSTPSSAAARAAAAALARVPRLRVHPARAFPIRSYFAGHPQIRDAEGQDMAQVRAGVRLRKALCAVLEHPSVSHRFEGTCVTILEVRMARDFKKAHVRWTVADAADDDVASSFSARKRLASAALRREATRLRSMASKMLRSKHTPRLVFVDDDAKSAKERDLDAAFARAAEADAEAEAYAAEARAREAEYASRPDASRRRGPYDDTLDTETACESNIETNDAETDGRFRYAFETHDGSTPYVSDFVDVAEETDAPPRIDAPPPRVDAAAWAAKVRAATRELRDAEEAWLEVGGDPAALDGDAFDADFDEAVDALVEELAESAAREVPEEEERDEDDDLFDDDDDDDDEDDEYVEGDEFDDEDEDEAVDFDFDKFDETEQRTRR